MGVQRRLAAIAVFVTILTFVAVQLPIKWHRVSWGTVPDWIGAVALLMVAVGVWRLALAVDRARGRSEELR